MHQAAGVGEKASTGGILKSNEGSSFDIVMSISGSFPSNSYSPLVNMSGPSQDDRSISLHLPQTTLAVSRTLFLFSCLAWHSGASWLKWVEELVKHLVSHLRRH